MKLLLVLVNYPFENYLLNYALTFWALLILLSL